MNRTAILLAAITLIVGLGLYFADAPAPDTAAALAMRKAAPARRVAAPIPSFRNREDLVDYVRENCPKYGGTWDGKMCHPPTKRLGALLGDFFDVLR